MTKPILAIDCDLTLLDSALGEHGWHEWLYTVCIGASWSLWEEDVLARAIDYDLSKYYILPEGYDAMDFWRGTNIYDTIPCVRGSVKAVTELSKYYEIIVVTAIKGNHHKSKINRLKRLFPEVSGFICTKEKQYVRCDVLVDDRATFLNRMPDNVKKVRFQTPFKQDEPDHKDTIVIDGWGNVAEYLIKEITK